MKKILPIIIILAIVGFITFKLVSNKKVLDEKKQPTKEVNVAIPVNTVTAKYERAGATLIKSGKLIPFKEADIMSISSGKLSNVNFQLGTNVAQGGVVAQIDTRGLQISLESANLTRSKANKDLKRYQTLLEGEATTEVTVQDVKYNLDNANNQIESINKQISDAKIKSPISGQVIAKNVEAGEFVAAGSILGKVVDVSRLKVKVLVNESDVYQLKLNQKVNVSTDVYANQIFDGKITFISNQGDATHSFEVEITLDNKKSFPLKAGTFAYVDFLNNSTQEYLMIPRSAIVASLQNPYIYVIENNKAVVRKIVVARDLGDMIAISSGINSGEVVITSGQINIKEGALVKPITEIVTPSK